VVNLGGRGILPWFGVGFIVAFELWGRVAGWWFIFLWKNNSLRSDIFFRQKNKPPPHDRQTI
jgi:hypothetical protein